MKINLGVPEFILKMGNPNARYIYEFGDFRLDAGHRMLYHKNEELTLAPKAVETLVALVERRGEIMSKDELLEAVWPDAIVEESNLFVYLSILRKTLGTQTDGQPWVETLRRRGYRFNGDVRLVTTQNGNGFPHVKPTPFKLVPATSISDTKRTAQVIAPPEPHRWTKRVRVFAAAGMVAVLAAGALTYRYFVQRPINSIAIMPFVNETGDAQLEYIPAGLTENFIASLSKVPDLKVQSKSSVSRYKGKETDPRIIGAELGVDAVLYGWLTKRGEEFELHVELVDTRSGVRLAEATGTRTMANLRLLERQIHRDLVSELRPASSSSTDEEVSPGHTINAEAYRLYLEGRFYSLKLTKSEIHQGITYLYQAAGKDPAFAVAYTGIARAHLFLGIAGEEDPSVFIRARDAAQRAIELDDTLAEGYSALAGVAFFYDRDFTKAENLYKRALELDPKSSTVHQQYADFLNKTGRHEEGSAEISRAKELEPFSPFINAFYAVSLPDNDEALQQIRLAIDLSPTNYLVHMFAAVIYRRKGMYDQAIAELRSAKVVSPEQTLSDVALIGTLKQSGNTDEA
ncbi:MAG TPA: winged helix-turn-helix domain-containing protein, partial [Pyrinomonadaceae bacterium]|nr:winged helix-turn-helix domain-containing protein [Pyrinomonadaceae bacterium]